MKTRHAGRVLIADGLMTAALGFKGGKLHYIGKSEDFLAISLTIEHPDMPETHEGEMLLIVNPSYINFIGAPGIRIEPKRSLLQRAKDSIEVLVYFWKL